MTGPAAGVARPRLALIGFGAAGQTFHAPLISATPELVLAAVVTGDPARQAQIAARYPEAAVYDSTSRLLADADRFDAVVIATPNRTHHPLALAAIEAGLATVVDKPLSGTAAQARELVAAAETAGTALTVFQNRRWDSNFRTVRRLAESGELGRVHRFESRHERWRPHLKGGWRELGDPGEAGGLLYDIGAHLIDQALLLLGPAARVWAEADVRRAGAQADDDSFVAIEHASGARSHLTMTMLAAGPEPGVRVLGDQGSYGQPGLDRQEDALRAGLRPDSAGWPQAVRPAPGRLTVGDRTREIEPEIGSHQAFYVGLAACLRGAAPVPVDPRDAVAVLDVIQAAGRSARTGQPVELDVWQG